jgi:hypothetical protein
VAVAKRRHNRPAPHGPEKENNTALQSAFERQVLHGLSAEWENALWMLPENLRQSISPPLFAIQTMQQRLGCWSPTKREITLSRELVTEHRWDDVRDVLLHEMAHQVAQEGLNAGEEADHGNSFQQACRFLQANPRASGSYPTLRQRLHQGEPLDEKDRMVIKIHKLMALAESSNPNEAHAAMRKAYQLIARHNVDLIRRGHHQPYTSIFLGRPGLRHFREAYHLAHLLQHFYFVQGVWVQAWVLEKERMGRVLEISGSPQNVQIAEYVHDNVCRYIDHAWEDYQKGRRLNRYRKTDFAVGVIEGFRTTLQQASAATLQDKSTGLPMRVNDRALARYLARRYSRLRSFSKSGPGHDGQILADGTECGRKLIIAKGIHHSAGFKEQTLEYQGKGNP